MTEQEKHLFTEEAYSTAESLGMVNELLEKRDKVACQSAIQQLERAITQLKTTGKLSNFKWVFSPAGDGYGVDSCLLNLTPDLPDKFAYTLEDFSSDF